MVYRGHVKNGAVILDPPSALLEGAEVEVKIVESATETEGTIPTLYERFESFIGKAENLPPDASINHDHYLYGVPKRS